MMKYIGGTRFIPGVPARDLSDDEVEQYGKKRLEDSGLYKAARRSPKKTESKSDKDGE